MAWESDFELKIGCLLSIGVARIQTQVFLGMDSPTDFVQSEQPTGADMHICIWKTLKKYTARWHITKQKNVKSNLIILGSKEGDIT